MGIVLTNTAMWGHNGVFGITISFLYIIIIYNCNCSLYSLKSIKGVTREWVWWASNSLPCTHLNARQKEKLQTLRKVIIRRPFWFGGLPPCERVLSEQIRRELALHWGKFSDFILLKRDKKRFNRAIIIRAMTCQARNGSYSICCFLFFLLI
jgi:hypothetical protein